MVTNWTELAAQAVKEGYAPNAWESLLKRTLERCRPKLVAELGSDLDAYVRTRSARAVKQFEMLTDQGTDPQTAQDLVRSDLLEVGSD